MFGCVWNVMEILGYFYYDASIAIRRCWDVVFREIKVNKPPVAEMLIGRFLCLSAE
jgi:hypothetical protein